MTQQLDPRQNKAIQLRRQRLTMRPVLVEHILLDNKVATLTWYQSWPKCRRRQRAAAKVEDMLVNVR